MKGVVNCGTQLKLSALFTGIIFNLLAYRFLELDLDMVGKWKVIYLLGNYSFGIFFSHLAIMSVLNHIPYYSFYIVYPINAVLTIIISFLFVFVGSKILGKYRKYFAM